MRSISSSVGDENNQSYALLASLVSDVPGAAENTLHEDELWCSSPKNRAASRIARVSTWADHWIEIYPFRVG